MEERKAVRKSGIEARNSLTEEEKVSYSAAICEQVISLPEYQNAKTVLLYKWTKGETRLEELEKAAAADGKRVLYPLCVSDTEMAAIEPGKGKNAWRTGAYGITEPDSQYGTIAEPEEIDLVICPCTTFDENCHRMGIGAGYYDRYLAKCTNAAAVAVAFEVQKSAVIHVNDYDVPMEAVVTETSLYRAEKRRCSWSAEMNRADKAEELFRSGYNCGQSVFAAFADVVGMTETEAAKIASPFGAGFGKLREVCGAVSGMTLVAGYLGGYDDPADAEGKKALYALIQKMAGEFEERHGSIICRELLGLAKGEDLAEPAVRTEEYYQSRPCVAACRTAAEIAEKYLLGKSKNESGDVLASV